MERNTRSITNYFSNNDPERFGVVLGRLCSQIFSEAHAAFAPKPESELEEKIARMDTYSQEVRKYFLQDSLD